MRRHVPRNNMSCQGRHDCGRYDSFIQFPPELLRADDMMVRDSCPLVLHVWAKDCCNSVTDRSGLMLRSEDVAGSADSSCTRIAPRKDGIHRARCLGASSPRRLLSGADGSRGSIMHLSRMLPLFLHVLCLGGVAGGRWQRARATTLAGWGRRASAWARSSGRVLARNPWRRRGVRIDDTNKHNTLTTTSIMKTSMSTQHHNTARRKACI